MISASLTLPIRSSSMKLKNKTKQKNKGIVAKSLASKSDSINEFISLIADKKGQIKIQTLIILLKGFGLYKSTNDAERVLRRLAPNGDGIISKDDLIDFFAEQFRYQRGKLTELDYIRTFQSFCRDGVLTFAHLKKNFDELANKIGERDAKNLIKMFSKGKDHLTKQDFVAALHKPTIQKKTVKK